MLKDFAWNAFELTGDIQSYFFYREMINKDAAGFKNEVSEEIMPEEKTAN